MLVADPEVEAEPEKYFDRVVEIDLTTLEPMIVGPHTPDLARSLSEIAAAVESEGYPDRLSAALVGSCTNSSYEDISRSAAVAQQAIDHGAKMKSNFMITPGSEQVRATLARDGQLDTLERIGGKVLANACGPCIGQWQRDDLATLPLVTGDSANTAQPKPRNSIINSFNRNFPRRNDGNPDTFSFIASPEIVIAYGLAGRLSFNPLTDPLEAPDGTMWMLEPPAAAPDLPAEGFVTDTTGFVPPADDGGDIEIKVDPNSKRLQLLTPFPAWDGQDYLNAPVLVKVKGKCTTDHISPAGPWLRFQRSSRPHQRQYVHRRDQCLYRRGGYDPQRPDRRGECADPAGRPRLQGGGDAVGRRGRRELRRGLQPGARRDGATLPRRGGDHRQVISRASTSRT